MKVYLAGPEVFLADAIAIGERKKDICRKYGLAGHYPLDAQIDVSGLPPADAARLIYQANVNAIDDSDALIANMAPLRGAGMDNGTAFEMGYAAALGIPIFAYTNDPRSYLGRARSLGIIAGIDQEGRSRDKDGLEIEDFGLIDNLMLVCAVRDLSKPFLGRAGSDLSRELDTGLAMFEATVQRAARALNER